MEDCLGLGNPLLFFVQLSHCDKSGPSITRLVTFMSSPLPLCSRKCSCFCSIGFSLASNSKEFFFIGKRSIYELSLIFFFFFACTCSALCSCLCALLFSRSVVFTLCKPMDCSLPGFPVSRSLLKLMSIESVMPSNHLILCRPLLLLPSIFPSIRVFSSESALLIRWPKNWNFSFSVNSSNEYSGLISFRIDWFDFCTIQLEFLTVYALASWFSRIPVWWSWIDPTLFL